MCARHHELFAFRVVLNQAKVFVLVGLHNSESNFKVRRLEKADLRSQKCQYAWYFHISSQFVMVNQTLCKDFHSFQSPSPSLYVASTCAQRHKNLS